jgi:hypothetical protein
MVELRILAADNMEGRETGSLGLRKAQEFVVEQLKRAGLEPVGSASYYQVVRFESRQIIEKESSLALVHNGEVEPRTLGEEAIFSTRVDLAHSVDAPLVFSETYYRARGQNSRCTCAASLEIAARSTLSGSGELATDSSTSLANVFA